jgi:hypothetical protein
LQLEIPERNLISRITITIKLISQWAVEDRCHHLARHYHLLIRKQKQRPSQYPNGNHSNLPQRYHRPRHKALLPYQRGLQEIVTNLKTHPSRNNVPELHLYSPKDVATPNTSLKMIQMMAYSS